MPKKEEKGNDKTEKETQGKAMRASIYEATEQRESGGVVHTKIYCFDTDKPILKQI